MSAATKILRRWRALDRALWEGFANLPRLAKQLRVSEKTLHRDLKAFQELGQQMYHARTEDGTYVWFYNREAGTRPLFTANLPLRN